MDASADLIESRHTCAHWNTNLELSLGAGGVVGCATKRGEKGNLYVNENERTGRKEIGNT